MYDIDAFQMKIADWANERNILEISNPMKQLEKTEEEVAELRSHTQELSEIVRVHSSEQLKKKQVYAIRDLIKDDIGDVIVTLSIQASMLGLTLSECLECAYSEIKDRKGKMVDGMFVKESK
jgi:predicted transcriptional regulator